MFKTLVVIFAMLAAVSQAQVLVDTTYPYAYTYSAPGYAAPLSYYSSQYSYTPYAYSTGYGYPIAYYKK